jgi:hypothetical protein
MGVYPFVIPDKHSGTWEPTPVVIPVKRSASGDLYFRLGDEIVVKNRTS